LEIPPLRNKAASFPIPRAGKLFRAYRSIHTDAPRLLHLH
jgi:hypothetical protein